MWAAWWTTTSGFSDRKTSSELVVADVDLVERGAGGEVLPLAAGQVVDDGHVVAQGQQAVAHVRGDEARSSGDQDLHVPSSSTAQPFVDAPSVVQKPAGGRQRQGSGRAADTLYSRGRSQGSAAVGTWRSLVAHLLWEQGVGGSNPLVPTTVRLGRQGVAGGCSSVGRASAFQAECRGFEPRRPLFRRPLATAAVLDRAPVAQLDGKVGQRAADTLYSRGRSQGSAAVGTWRSLVAHLLWEQGVGGSNPLVPTMASARRQGVAGGCSSVGRASAFQAECRGFEPRRPLFRRPLATAAVLAERL